MNQLRKFCLFVFGVICISALMQHSNAPAARADKDRLPADIGMSPQADPNLIITDIWPDEEGNICYQIMNSGKAEAPAGHFTALTVDGSELAQELVSEVLSEGERFSTCFIQDWVCSDPDDTISVYANKQATITESNLADNERIETLKCDSYPPSIPTPPVVSEISSNSALISWSTDEDSNSIVEYDTVIGDFSLSEQSDKLTASHAILLSGLTPKTTYQFRVRSLDASSNEAMSEASFFETEPEADSTYPTADSAWVERQASDYLNFLIEAPASDNQKVERVEFFLDGALVGYRLYPWRQGCRPGSIPGQPCASAVGNKQHGFLPGTHPYNQGLRYFWTFNRYPNLIHPATGTHARQPGDIDTASGIHPLHPRVDSSPGHL